MTTMTTTVICPPTDRFPSRTVTIVPTTDISGIVECRMENVRETRIYRLRYKFCGDDLVLATRSIKLILRTYRDACTPVLKMIWDALHEYPR